MNGTGELPPGVSLLRLTEVLPKQEALHGVSLDELLYRTAPEQQQSINDAWELAKQVDLKDRAIRRLPGFTRTQSKCRKIRAEGERRVRDFTDIDEAGCDFYLRKWREYTDKARDIALRLTIAADFLDAQRLVNKITVIRGDGEPCEFILDPAHAVAIAFDTVTQEIFPPLMGDDDTVIPKNIGALLGESRIESDD